MEKRRVVITGLGTVNPLGNNTADSWAAAKSGKCGIGPITQFDTTDFKCKLAGEVKGFDPDTIVDKKEARKMARFTVLALAAAAEAVADSGLDTEAEAKQIGVILSSGIGGLPTIEEQHTRGEEKGMEKVCGPLSFSDLEREGLLIDGFDQLSTFEEQYNYDYYARLIEACGYSKEVDWYEYYLTCPETIPDIYRKTAERMLEMNGLHVATERNKRKFIEKYKDGIFHCLDACYAPLYGTVPMTEEMKKQIVDQFMLIIRIDFVSVICDKDENVVAFGLCFPSMGEALAGTNGKLTPRNLCRLLRAVRNPKVLDLGLIAVLPEYRLRGVNAYFLYGLMKWMKEHNIEHLETNLCLEYNQAVQSQWDVFPHRIHKKRRSYIKTL